MEACGVTAGWGENIAYGYSTASAVMNGWLNSSGHRANIERSTFRAIGVGAAANGSGTLYWAQAFGTSTFDAGGGGGPTSPSVSLTSTPSPETTSTSASFGWSTSGSPTSTTCSIDGAAAVACTSPRSYSGLAVGGHTFRVTVANSAGSASALHSWSVTSAGGGGTGAPTVTITQRPARVSSSTAATFAWTTGGAVTSTTCSLDNAVATPCSSPKSYSGMSRTSHSFRVTVSGPSGSRSKTVSWRIS